MKLYNTIIVFDVYAAAENEADALQAVLMHIKEGLPPSEQTAIEAREARNIRESWREQHPFVGAAVSDEDFTRLKGKTTDQIFAMLYTKQDSSTK